LLVATILEEFPSIASALAEAEAAMHASGSTPAIFKRSFDFVTRDFPFFKDSTGSIQSLLGADDVAPSFVLAADNTVLTAMDAGRSTLPAGPYRFWSTINLLNTAGTALNPFFNATLPATPGLLSLSLTSVVSPDLSFTVPEVRGSAADILPTYPGKTGKGIIVGIIDYGFDYAHPNFLKPDGTSRLIALWDQNSLGASTGVDLVLDDLKPSPNWHKGAGAYSNTYIYTPTGQFTTSTNVWPPSAPFKVLNDLVKLADPYSGSGNYDPHAHYFVNRAAADEYGAHGTHVADIAVGNGAATGRPGVAPEADIVFVQLPEPANSGGPADLATVLDAVHFIIAVAEMKGVPAVINLCVNANSGPHDGSGQVDLLDKYALGTSATGLTKPVSIVVSAGNQYVLARDRAKLDMDPISGTVWRKKYRETMAQWLPLTAATPDTFMWVVRKGDTSENRLRLYYRVTNRMDDVSVSVSGRLLDPTPASQAAPGANNVPIKSSDAATRVGRILKRLTLPADDSPRLIEIEIEPAKFPVAAPLDDFIIEVKVTSVSTRNVHAFVERDGMNLEQQSALGIANADLAIKLNGCTLGTLSCGAKTVVVGAYFANDVSGVGAQIAEFSSAGPALKYPELDNQPPGVGNVQPSLSAPGMAVLAARSMGGRTVNGVTRDVATFMSGTSMAAPHVTGAIALMLHKTSAATSMQIKDILQTYARRDTPQYGIGKRWDPRLGFGRLDVKAAMDKI